MAQHNSSVSYKVDRKKLKVVLELLLNLTNA